MKSCIDGCSQRTGGLGSTATQKETVFLTEHVPHAPRAGAMAPLSSRYSRAFLFDCERTVRSVFIPLSTGTVIFLSTSTMPPPPPRPYLSFAASEVFIGLCNEDRLAIVFTALFDGLIAAGDEAAPPTAAATPQTSHIDLPGMPERGLGNKAVEAGSATRDSGSGVRGSVKASFVGANIWALPVWGGLYSIAGTSLLVECRTPAQWQARRFLPTEQVVNC